MKRIGLLLVGLALLSGCRDRKAEAEVDDFARLYARLRVASSSREGQPEHAKEARSRILREEGADLGSFRTKLRELQKNPDRWRRFWTRVEFVADSLANPVKKGS
ncbi:MAG TPA: hypothetical protein PKO15_01085 [Fibrobacteria bacterium]|nr:hypothetical protein [Fibrobacteria bacterium]HOX50688.1 hypothetical protein [Fibrobacteria bacterium]